jgi:glutaredoxin 3
MITIITKGYCPYCAAATTLLNKVGVEYINIDITLKLDLYNQVKEITGSQTVPQVFI